jgi:hypothetical protein
MSLKVRVSIALAAIAVICLSFHIVPRWWHSHPRFYPESYAAALGVLA